MKTFLKKKNQYNNVILSETKNLMRSFTSVQDDNQRGRSMVEMLGVLAVIGILSVAGIAGYSIAMRSYRTNEIVNAASMLHILAMAQNAGNGPTANVGYTDVGGNANPSGVSTLQYNKDTKEISITFTDTDDCTMAANKLGDKATADCHNKTITVNFGESSTNTTEERPTFDESTGSCPDGWKVVSGPKKGCGKSLEDALLYCQESIREYIGHEPTHEIGIENSTCPPNGDSCFRCVY